MSNEYGEDISAFAEKQPVVHDVFSDLRPESEVPEFDKPEDILDLEIKHWATDFLRGWYRQPDLSPLEQSLAPLYSPMHTVDTINNQFASKILPCLLDYDIDKGLEAFRQVTHNTIDEEMVLLLNDRQFRSLYTDLNLYLTEHEASISKAVEENIHRIRAADDYQFSETVSRNLEKVRLNGSQIYINPDSKDKIYAASEIAGDGILPLTEYLKNDKILGVSGFMGSKISLAVHDVIDHAWTFDMLEKVGLLDKFSNMFNAIGNPEATDIFKREGEVVASISYGIRYYYSMPPGFGPVYRSSHIEAHMDQLFMDRELIDRHMEAYRIIKQYRRGSMEWQSLGFAFSNYVTELDEQKRKYGSIKMKDSKSELVFGELDPFSVDFISFFIEAHKQILNPKNKHRDDLFRIHILLEEYLSSFANGNIHIDQPLYVTVDQLREIDFRQTTLPPNRIKWMSKNPGFTATRGAII